MKTIYGKGTHILYEVVHIIGRTYNRSAFAPYMVVGFCLNIDRRYTYMCYRIMVQPLLALCPSLLILEICLYGIGICKLSFNYLVE